MKARPVVLALVAVAVWGVPGCGSKGEKLVAVRGTIKFADGSVPQGEVRRINFDYVGEAKGGHRSAFGEIKDDGSFEMMTFKPADGVIPGRYKVLVTVLKKYSDPKSLVVPQKYVDAKTTPLEVNVEKAINDLELKLDKS